MLSWPSQNIFLCRPLLFPLRSVLMTVYQLRRTRQGTQGDVRCWRRFPECRQGRSSKLVELDRVKDDLYYFHHSMFYPLAPWCTPDVLGMTILPNN